MLSEKIKDILNQGIADSLNAQRLMATALVEAKQLSERAISWFLQANTLSPESAIVLGALGHHLYFHATEFDEASFEVAYDYFNRALEQEPDNVTFLCEAGLCCINIGDLTEASAYFESALAYDNSKETRNFISAELTTIGQRVFEHGYSLLSHKSLSKTHCHKKFAVSILMIAFQIDGRNGALARRISQWAELIGDGVTADEYKKLAHNLSKANE